MKKFLTWLLVCTIVISQPLNALANSPYASTAVSDNYKAYDSIVNGSDAALTKLNKVGSINIVKRYFYRR